MTTDTTEDKSPTKSGGGLAVAALVLGIVALVFSLIPIVGAFVAIPCGLVGGVLGAFGWKGGEKRGMAIAGTIMSVIAIVISIIVIATISSAIDDLDDDAEVTTTQAAPTTEAAPATESASKTETSPAQTEEQGGSLSDGGWTVEEASIQLKEDGLGDFGGTIRATNESGSDVSAAIFTLTVFSGNAQVASMQGTATEVEAGDTVTVQLLSSDSYVAGPYEYDFQTDVTF